jgi:uncharacterized protein DUF4905
MPIFAGMTIQPFISEHFNGGIWRMEIDELSETLFVEIRNNEERQVSFGSVNLKSGEVYFKDFTTPEPWLTGIEAAYDSVLLLHYYQSESGPTHKGVLAVDAISGTTLWSNYTFAFDRLTANGPVVYDVNIQPRKLFLADVKTGSTTRIYEPYVYQELQNNIILPATVSPEFLPPELINLHPFGNMVHYLEYNNLRIVSLHALKGGQLTQSLCIMDGVDKVYEDLLNSDIQKIQPEAFIIRKNHLIYIKNRSELKVLSL